MGATQLNSVKYLNRGEYNFAGYTLLLPAVSVGNVGQLAVDLYLENINPSPMKIGQLFHTALEPVVGNGGDGNILVACEIFRHVEQKVVILQFHSPVIKRSQGQFVSFLVDWIKTSNFQEVICLGSSMASFRNDTQLSVSAMRYLAGTALNSTKIQEIKRLGWTQLEPRASTEEDGYLQLQDGGININGGGIARDLFLACNASNIPILTLIVFASDGDNTPESTGLVRCLNQLYNFLPSLQDGENRLLIPCSWKYFNGGSLPAPIF